MQNNSRKGGVGLWLLVIIVLAVGGFLWYRSRYYREPLPPINVSTNIEENITVIYDTKGFSPNTVTIKKGGTAVFQNKTGKRASIASNDHPTHTKYPEFDQYKTEARGQDEFRFVFEKAGAWVYHDHLNSSMTGTIIVIE